ncbi:dihydroorotase [Thermodesulfobacteriota bacterium]
MKILIKGGEVVDPVNGVIEKQDIVVENGKVSKILQPAENNEDSKIEIIDASGKVVIPGLIDMHVHLREPGQEHKETIMSGAIAGVAGGFTGLACMPNTYPVNDNSAVTEYIMKQAEKADLLRIYPIASITKGLDGESLTEFGDLKKSGAKGLSDDGLPVKNSEVMRRALEYANYHQLTVISHCEDHNLSAGGVMHEGTVSAQIGLPGIPAASEEIMVQREISLARLTNCPVHIAHVSCEGSVDAIRRAKEQGIKVTAETAPHYFSLDHSAVIGYDTNTKMNPPLRSPRDVQAIKDGLAADVIDVIATDHAPHEPLVKRVEFDKAAFGIIGLETSLPLTLALVRDGVISLASAIRKLSYNPAKILGVPGGKITEGAAADITVIDPEVEYVLNNDDIRSKSKNSPFIGEKLRGRSILTMVNGRIVWERNE